MKSLFDIEQWINTPEKRMRLARLFYLITLVMTVLGFILIILSLIYEDFLP